MKFYGVDFTSSPSKRKPLVISVCREHADKSGEKKLALNEFILLETLTDFEQWIGELTDSVVGIDAPFGYPPEFRDALGLIGDWTAQAHQIEALGLERILSFADDFRRLRPAGQKEPLRSADRVTESVSSMKMFNPPIGRMAARLIPILARTQASIWPVRLATSSTTIFEIYCTPFVRTVIGWKSYKNPSRNVTNSHQSKAELRAKVLGKLPILVSDVDKAKVLDDGLGDFLDALIGAYEAFEGFKKLNANLLLVPDGVDELEGWTVYTPVIQAERGTF
jgi:hypothetical protein